jgi:hypothetical protein
MAFQIEPPGCGVIWFEFEHRYAEPERRLDGGTCCIPRRNERLRLEIAQVEGKLAGAVSRIKRRTGRARGHRQKCDSRRRPICQNQGDAIVCAEAESM